MKKKRIFTVIQVMTVFWMLLIAGLMDSNHWGASMRNIVIFILGGMTVASVMFLQFAKTIQDIKRIEDEEIEQFQDYLQDDVPPDEGRRR